MSKNEDKKPEPKPKTDAEKAMEKDKERREKERKEALENAPLRTAKALERIAACLEEWQNLGF
jgi:hypothetical protein